MTSTLPIRPRRGLRLKQVMAKVGAGETAIKEGVKAGVFPAPFKIMPGGKSNIWDESEIDQHLEKMMAERDAALEPSAREPKPSKRSRRVEA